MSSLQANISIYPFRAYELPSYKLLTKFTVSEIDSFCAIALKSEPKAVGSTYNLFDTIVAVAQLAW